jgi:hypothetical protein
MRTLALAVRPAVAIDVDDFEDEPRAFNDSEATERGPYDRAWLADVLTPEQEAAHEAWMSDLRQELHAEAAMRPLLNCNGDPAWRNPTGDPDYERISEAIARMMEED